MTQKPADGVSRREFLTITGSTGALALAGCVKENPVRGDGGSLQGQISISGSSTVFPLATAMKEAFQKEHSEVSINVNSTGSGGGFENYFCPGNSDFNNASRPIQDAEKQSCRSNGVQPVELTVATDALTVIVNNNADWIDCITVEELKKIWSGGNAVQKWSDVRSEWPDEEMVLHGPTEASGTYDYFIEAILGEEGSHRQDYQPTEQDRTLLQGVSEDKYAMGYLGFAYYTQNQNRVKALGIDDGDGCVEPSLETAKSGEYTPLSRPLFTYPSKSSLAEDHVAAFAKFWVENLTNRKIIADKVGYVPLSEGEQSKQMKKLQTAIDEANGN